MSSDNLESVGYLELGSQELNNMVMSVFEQSTAITQSSISDPHDTDSSQIHGLIKKRCVHDTVLLNVKVLSMIIVIKPKRTV